MATMILLIAALVSVVGALDDTGKPAGLIPNCPGAFKNASISSRSLQQLQVVIYRVSHGKLYKDMVPITTAARMISKSKSFDLKRKKTVLYAEGFFDSSITPHSQAVGDAYVRRGYNVIMTETIRFLSAIYPRSVRITQVIGRKLAHFLSQLQEQGLSPDNLELVGMSLGAHIVSFTAKNFYQITGQKPSRVSGIDPAGPCFRNMGPEYRLDSSDAHKVDVVHTNVDGFGMAEPIGHVDIYINGGEYQPSDIIAIPCLVICSHVKSIIYWWQAILNPKMFIAMKCESVQSARLAECYNATDDINYMGLETNFDKPGLYYLSTSNLFPYYRGKDGLKAENEIYTSETRKINMLDNYVV